MPESPHYEDQQMCADLISSIYFYDFTAAATVHISSSNFDIKFSLYYLLE